MELLPESAAIGAAGSLAAAHSLLSVAALVHFGRAAISLDGKSSMALHIFSSQRAFVYMIIFTHY